MTTVYVKKLSGEVISVELSPYGTLRYSVENALDVKPGYRARLFDEDGELEADAEAFDGEEFSVLIEPYDFTVSQMEVDRVEDPRSGTSFTKYMLELDEGTFRVYYYESVIGFLVERDVAFEAFGEIEFEPEHLLASLSDVLDRLFPEWDEEVRAVILEKI
jgi:hypothetical protein